VGLDEIARRKAQRANPTAAESNAASDEAVLSEDALNGLLQLQMQGQGSPTFGMGKAGVQNKVRYYNKLGELMKHGGLDVGTRVAAAKAEQAKLKTLTGTQGAANAFAEMVEKNVAVLEPTLKHLPDTGNTWANAVLRPAAKGFGNRGMSEFTTARQTVVNEFARILNNPALSGAGVISDSARHEMEKIIDPNATVGQIKASIKILRQDKNNRLKAYDDAIRQSQQTIKSLGMLPGSTAAPAPAGGAATHRYDPATGTVMPIGP
jgi:hypothetical protein